MSLSCWTSPTTENNTVSFSGQVTTDKHVTSIKLKAPQRLASIKEKKKPGEKPGSTVRIILFDFSGAFNTIQPALVGDKLGLTSWILDYLTNQPQHVRTWGYVSDTMICSTGAPQGTVLAPFLFTLYTADFSHQSAHCHLQKF